MVCSVVLGQSGTPKFDLQGHRGARGLLPENTVPGFIKALDLGVTTLEMDLAMSKDGQIVVSHEPYLSAAICLSPDGKPIAEAQEKSFNLYQMDYAQIKLCDCGSLGNPRFATQKPMKTHKPLLADVIRAAEWHIKSHTQYEVDYNIEIKSHPKGDGLFHPKPAVFSDSVYQLIERFVSFDRVVIQSFDFRVLQYWHQKYPHVRLAALVENNKGVAQNLDDLGFKPAIYSPYFKLLKKDHIQGLRQQGVKVIPWTVNKTKHMKKMVAWGVDGLITDYPDRASNMGLALFSESQK